MAVEVVPLRPVFEDLLLGAKPILFVLAGFTTTVFIRWPLVATLDPIFVEKS